jgi:hypothetical protein
MEERYSQEELLRRLEKHLLQPEVRQSAEAVADLLADDFFEFGSSGQVFNKQQIIEGLQQEPPAQRSLMQFKATVLAPGVVLATYRAVLYSSSGEPPVYSPRSSIWKYTRDRWQMVFHQGTLSNKIDG